ncbi:MAG: helix-turn-helix domain-containing protein [Clostridiales bacterium]|nr:helix-turn-helix domain-containing protein [Eubacteriales bacterium]MDH7566831.1 helix-turn-helix domain-containing protein [Clostridiales bacterium]
MEKEFITTKELCVWLKISNNTANNWRRKGLPYVKVGNTIRYDRQAVEKWLYGKEEKNEP